MYGRATTRRVPKVALIQEGVRAASLGRARLEAGLHGASLTTGGGVPRGHELVTALNSFGYREVVTALNAQGRREPVWAKRTA